MGIVTVESVDNAAEAARKFSYGLVANKGILNHIESNDGRIYDVVTCAGQRYRFCQK